MSRTPSVSTATKPNVPSKTSHTIIKKTCSCLSDLIQRTRKKRSAKCEERVIDRKIFFPGVWKLETYVDKTVPKAFFFKMS